MMTRRRVFLGGLCAGAALGGGWPALAAARRSRTMQLLDPDSDGTVDLDETRKAASTLFDRLDRNRNGSLNKRELGGRVTQEEFAAVDADKDGSLSKNEYLAVVERRFKAADQGNDGKLTEKELRSYPGRALLRLLLF
jgi:Ca2+-binding EF-hand superfamily protein